MTRRGGGQVPMTWRCNHCGCHSFARRPLCFRCKRPKGSPAPSQDKPATDGEPPDGAATLGQAPVTGAADPGTAPPKGPAPAAPPTRQGLALTFAVALKRHRDLGVLVDDLDARLP